MILIDAIFINNGGGKVLLDYLVVTLEKTDLEVFYLFDDRIKKTYSIKEKNQTLYQNSSLKLRRNFYKKYKLNFSTVLVLGNIPPPLKLKNTQVFTYFHNTILINVPGDFSTLEKIKYYFKVKILKLYSVNTNYWLLQSNILSKQFIEKFRQNEKVKVLPFYPSLSIVNNKHVIREKDTMIYVSNAQANKNHRRLISAFCKSYDVTKKGKLILTVSDKFPAVLKNIERAVGKGYPIENIGFVDRLTIAKKYLQSEYVIFPSLSESFGLGLIEGIELGCKIIGADLPYTYAVCDPSLVFNPYDITSLSDTISLSQSGNINVSKLKVSDQIAKLINLLK